ncbi:putative ribonuclease H-like domain-containing protein [Tanacetum coccineum]
MDFKEKRPVSLNKSKIECYNCQRKGHFVKECRSGRSQGRRSYGDNGRSNTPTNESSSQALVAQDGLGGYDWSNDFEVELVNYALMAISSSSLSSSSDIKKKIFDGRSSDDEHIPENDRFSKNGYKAVPPPITGNFLTPRADISFAGLDEYAIRNKIIESQTLKRNNKTDETAGKTNDANTEKPKSVSESVVSNPKINRDSVIIEDWTSDDEEEVSGVQKVRPETRDDKSGQNSHKQGVGFRKVKACFVCKSTDHLIKDYYDDYNGGFIWLFLEVNPKEGTITGLLLDTPTSSKAFGVYNKRTKRVKENMHINFLENQPNVAGTGPNWIFDLDFLTNSLNYIPVSVENQVNVDVDQDVQDLEDVAGKEEQHQMQENEKDLQDELEMMITQELAAKALDDVSRQAFEEEKRIIASQKKATQATSINQLSTDRPSVSTDRPFLSTDRSFVSTDRSNTPNVSAASTSTGANADESSFVYLGGEIPINASTLPNADLPIDPNMPDLEDAFDTLPNDGIFNGAYDDDEDVGAVADFNNMDNTIANRTNHKDHQNYLFAYFLSQEEPKTISQALKDESWVEAMQEELLQFKLQQDWILANLRYGKKVIDPTHPNKVYKVIKALYGLHQAPRAWYETLSSFLLENGFKRGTIDKTLFIKKNKSDIMLVKKQPDGIFISQDKYVADILKKFDFCSIKTSTTLIESNKPLVKDEDGVELYIAGAQSDMKNMQVALHIEILVRKGGDNYKQARMLMFYPKLTKLEFPTYRRDEDPTRWFTKVDQFFEYQSTPVTQKVSLASYHFQGEANKCFDEPLSNAQQKGLFENMKRSLRGLEIEFEDGLKWHIDNLSHRIALGMERDCQHGLYKAGMGSSRVLSDFAEKYGSKNRVLAGFGIGGKAGERVYTSWVVTERG